MTIAAGATTSTGTVTVTAVDNTTDAPDKGVTVSATVSGDSGVSAPASVTLTITDDEAPPGVRLAVAAASISEDGGTTTVTATLSHASSAATTVTVRGVTGAYTVGSDATITIAAGDTANTADSVTITAVNDAVDNVGNRSVTVTGTAANAQATADGETMSVTGAALTITEGIRRDPGGGEPTFDPDTFAAQRYLQNSTIGRVSLPAATGGDGTLTYTLRGPEGRSGLRLPAGIVYRAPSAGAGTGGRLSGTPTEVAAEATYTLTATDADGDTAALTFTIVVKPDLRPVFEATIADQEWIEDESITPVRLPAAVGGNGRLSYRLTPALPNGVTRDPVTQVLTGTPTEESSRTEYTWTATDADGDTAALTFTIVVKPDLMPSFEVTVADQEWVEDESITAVRLPAAVGGNGRLSYRLTPALPNGVTRDPVTQVLTGTPTEESSRTEYTWTATDADGDTAALTFAITVKPDLMPSFEATVADQEWIEGESITAVRLPAAVGGNGRLSYRLTPALPSGVTRDPSTQVLTGTPTEESSRTEYTWTATDADGDTAALTFAIVVKPDLMPSFEGDRKPTRSGSRMRASRRCGCLRRWVATGG